MKKWYKAEIQEIVTSHVWAEAESQDEFEEIIDGGSCPYQREVSTDYAEGIYNKPFTFIGEVSGRYKDD